MHIQTKCLSMIYHLILIYDAKNKKTQEFGLKTNTNEL
jgi:hypothetical protein